MDWSTRVTELLGSRYPIIQGAFGGFGNSALAAPVSEAGGFGIITASALRTPAKLREDIMRARSMTDGPFGVNLSVGLCPSIDEMRETAIEERVPVIFTAAYRADDHGRRIHDAGLKWVHKVVTIQHAVAAERQGADAVVIVGLEGTAFKSIYQLPTLVGVTTAVQKLKIPIIAAGGIGDARGLLAALAMGAEGVYMGTRFLATKECPISQRHKQKLVDADPWDPEFKDRCLAPPRAEEYENIMKERGSISQDEWLVRLEQVMFRHEPETGLKIDSDWGAEEALRIAGGSLAVGVIKSVPTVKELIEGIIREAEEILAGAGPLGRLFGSTHT
ncbi:MAG: nitronate monooxygenase [Dehalococcoidia bacterium]|nr:nitronate monooxygenase [Dehalococcoidia bacterium]